MTCRFLVLPLVLTPCRSTTFDSTQRMIQTPSRVVIMWTPSATPHAYMPTDDHAVSCRDMSSLKRLTFTGPCPTIRLSFILSSRHPCLRARPSPSVTLRHRTALDRDALQLQRILTETSTWTQRLTDTTPSQRANLHIHDSWTQLPRRRT